MDRVGRARRRARPVAHRAVRAAARSRGREVPPRRRAEAEGRPPRGPIAATRAASTLDLARAYFDLGKFKQTLALLRDQQGDPEVDDLASEALLRSGAVREAERAAAAASEATPPGPARGRLLANAGVFAALGHDGTPFGAGARPDVARSRLAQATAEAPRLLEAGKALVEVLREARADAAALAELRRLGRLNPNLLALDGPFRSWHEELRSKETTR